MTVDHAHHAWTLARTRPCEYYYPDFDTSGCSHRSAWGRLGDRLLYQLCRAAANPY
jgi:hypothetical protein